MNKQTAMSPLLTLSLGLLGFAFAAVVLLIDSSQTQRSADFVRTPYFLAWLVMNGFQGGFWAVVLVPLIHWLRQLHKGWQKRRRDVALGLIILLAVVVISNYFFAEIYHPKDLPLYNHLTRLLILNLIGNPLALAAIVGIWLVQGELEAELNVPRLNFQQAEKMIMLRRLALQFLGIAGFIIGAATLSFGVLRNAVLAVEPSRLDFPKISVIVWGLFYSGLLALAYAPTHLAFADAERRLESDITPAPSAADSDQTEWLKEKDELKEHLSADRTGWSQFRTLLSILAPLTGSIIPVLMGF